MNRDEILEAAENIEPLPASVSRLVGVVSEPDFDARAIVDIVAHDPALAGEVLARANSAASGSHALIGELQLAAARIGANAVVEIAIRRSIQARFGAAVPAYGLGPNQLWHHSVMTSVAADVVRIAATTTVIPPMITTAALVHDIGKIVIAKCLASQLTAAISAAAAADSVDLAEVEREVLGIDHGEAGALVVRSWGLPLSVQIALGKHHRPATGDLLTQALALADHLAHAARERSDDTTDADDLGLYMPAAAPHAAAVGIPMALLPSLVIQTDRLTRRVVQNYGSDAVAA